MIRVEFSSGWAGIFEQAGLRTLEDFFDYSDGQIINRNKKREVVAMTLGGSDGNYEFFMKRFFKPHFKDMLFTVRNFGRMCSQATCEWNNAGALLKAGVGTYIPICRGEETTLGLEKRSFFITEKIKGQCFTDFVRLRWDRLAQSEKEAVIVSLAQVIRRVHEAGISLPDLYVWHVFITEKEDGGCDFAIIDLHRMKINVTSRAERIRNLGAFYFSMSAKYFDDDIKHTFLDAYLGPGRLNEKDVFLRGVEHRCAVLERRRRRLDY